MGHRQRSARDRGIEQEGLISGLLSPSEALLNGDLSTDTYTGCERPVFTTRGLGLYRPIPKPVQGVPYAKRLWPGRTMSPMLSGGISRALL